MLAGSADATWSIILIDTTTGEVAAGSATCLTGFDLRANTPVLIVGVGAATAQSFVDSLGQNRGLIRDQLLKGTHPEDIIDLLAVFDTGHQTRQYGIADTRGGVATFTGTSAGAWAGGEVGSFVGRTGEIVYAIQGNVLTGEPVVLQAVQAAIETEGDLAEKLMASMFAAYMMGGDGRCSCSGADPTGCGSPPDEFDKSAHIAYMLIARAGDTDGCKALYRAGTVVWGVASADFDGDGRVDLVSGDLASANVHVLLNTTEPGQSLPHFTQAQAFAAQLGARDVATADVNGDGYTDVVTANATTSQVAVVPGLGDGQLGAAGLYAVGSDPQTVVVRDLNGDGWPDIATGNAGGNSVSVLLNDGTGAFGAAQTIGAGGTVSSIDAADTDGDGDVDLIVTVESLDVVVTFVNDGSGSFALGELVFVGDQPKWVIAADVDSDGDTDLAVAERGPDTVRILLRQGGVFVTGSVVTVDDPIMLARGDMDNDGIADLVVLQGATGQISVLRGAADGSFSLAGSYVFGLNNNRIDLGDFNGDGLLDVAGTPLSNNGVMVAENLGGGVFTDGLGFATGDYWMNFNIAFAQTDDPDPVLQLLDLFDAWRADLVGRPDAVQSVVSFEPAKLVADGSSTGTMRIELLDWQQLPITVPIRSVSVEHAEDSAGSTTIGAISDLGGGVIEVALTAGDVHGEDRFVVVVDDGIRPVTLMPDPAIEISYNADVNGDGVVNIFDFLAFQGLITTGDPAADCNSDGVLDIVDFLCFQAAVIEQM